MERRSSAERFVHFGGSIVSNVESSHGVEISGGSTGGLIEPISDDTNASLTIRAKNDAPLVLGNSSNARVTLLGSTVLMGSSGIAQFSNSTISIGTTMAGAMTIGNSSFIVTIAGSGITLGAVGSTGSFAGSSFTFATPVLISTRALVGGASTSAMGLIQRYAIDFTPPVLAAAEAAWQTYTVTGLSTQSAVFISPHLAFSSQYVWSSPRCSTADQLSVLWTNQLGSSIGTGESTNQWRVVQFAFA